MRDYLQDEVPLLPKGGANGAVEVFEQVPRIDLGLGVTSVFSHADILELVPSKDRLDRYLATWFATPDRLAVILHRPTFQEEYLRYWSNSCATDLGWLALLLSVGSTGAEILAQTCQDRLAAIEAEDLRRLTAHALVLAEWSKPRSFVIEAMLFLVKSSLFKDHDVTTSVWHLQGMIMRCCWNAGYHRDPSHNPKISAFDREMRRRV